MELNKKLKDDVLNDVCYFYEIDSSLINKDIPIVVEEMLVGQSRGKIIDDCIVVRKRSNEDEIKLIPVVLHELSHFAERIARKRINEIANNFFNSKNMQITEKEIEEILGEAILRTLLPNGWLAVKYGLREEKTILRSPEKAGNEKEDEIKELKFKILPIIKSLLERKETLFSNNNIIKICGVYYEILRNKQKL